MWKERREAFREDFSKQEKGHTIGVSLFKRYGVVVCSDGLGTCMLRIW